MSGSLKRAGTVWPGSSATTAGSYRHGTLYTNPEEESLGFTEGSNLEQTFNETLSDPPIEAVPPPPKVHANSQLNRIADRLKPRLLNRYAVPTAGALCQSIVVTPASVWNSYEAIAVCYNQGDGVSTLVSRVGPTSSEEHGQQFSIKDQDKLYVVKEQRWESDTSIRHFIKPTCTYLVELHSAFCVQDKIWVLYEEMEMSLEQIFELECDPWSVNPGYKDAQIAAICFQVTVSFVDFCSLITDISEGTAGSRLHTSRSWCRSWVSDHREHIDESNRPYQAG
jgi:hypothetical protein